jgi:hypothetical protein
MSRKKKPEKTVANWVSRWFFPMKYQNIDENIKQPNALKDNILYPSLWIVMLENDCICAV